MRTIRYKQIADELRTSIRDGQYGQGQLLASEAELGASFGASRVTIRKALEALRAEGLVESRQGYGWMVAAERVPQSLETLITIERQLLDSGRSSQRNIIDFKFVETPGELVAVLGSRVLEVRRVNMADDQPFAVVTVWCREDLGATVSRADVSRASFFELLPNVAARASQTISARAADQDESRLLAVPVSSPVLVVRRTTYDATDRAALVSEHTFPGHLTEFAVELTSSGADGDRSTPGLRLVEGG